MNRALCGLLVLVLGAMESPDADAAQSPVWEDLSVSQDLAHRHPGSMIPVWYDVNLDGQRDPVWLSYDGVETLVLDEDGNPKTVSVEMPTKFKIKEGPEILGAVLDADGDGDEEIMVFGFEAALLEAGGELPLIGVTIPVIAVEQIAEVIGVRSNHVLAAGWQVGGATSGAPGRAQRAARRRRPRRRRRVARVRQRAGRQPPTRVVGFRRRRKGARWLRRIGGTGVPRRPPQQRGRGCRPPAEAPPAHDAGRSPSRAVRGCTGRST